MSCGGGDRCGSDPTLLLALAWASGHSSNATGGRRSACHGQGHKKRGGGVQKKTQNKNLLLLHLLMNQFFTHLQSPQVCHPLQITSQLPAPSVNLSFQNPDNIATSFPITKVPFFFDNHSSKPFPPDQWKPQLA